MCMALMPISTRTGAMESLDIVSFSSATDSRRQHGKPNAIWNGGGSMMNLVCGGVRVRDG